MFEPLGEKNTHSLCCAVLRCSQVFATPWPVAHQAPLAMGFSRQEYWSGLPYPSPWILPSPGWNLHLLHWQAHSLPLSHLRRNIYVYIYIYTHTRMLFFRLFPLIGYYVYIIKKKFGGCITKSLTV